MAAFIEEKAVETGEAQAKKQAFALAGKIADRTAGKIDSYFERSHPTGGATDKKQWVRSLFPLFSSVRGHGWVATGGKLDAATPDQDSQDTIDRQEAFKTAGQSFIKYVDCARRSPLRVLPHIAGSHRPRVLHAWTFAAFILLSVALGVTLEVMLALSERWNGLCHMDDANSQALHFVVTTLPGMVIGYVYSWWTSLDSAIQRYMPLVQLHRGPAPAERSILLNYSSLSLLDKLRSSARFRHFLVTLTALTAFFLSFLSSFGNGALQTKQILFETPYVVPTWSNFGLSPLASTLVPFASGAGVVHAIANWPGTEPAPFIWNDDSLVGEAWTVAGFDPPGNLPDYVLGGNITVLISTLRHRSGCQPAQSVSVTANSLVANFGNCSETFALNVSTTLPNYSVRVSSACSDAGLNATRQAVAFWAVSGGRGAATLCKPTLDLFTSNVTRSIGSGAIIDVVPVLPVFDTSYGLLGSHILNGIASGPTTDPLLIARSAAISTLLPGAAALSLVGGDTALRNLSTALSDPLAWNRSVSDAYALFLAHGARDNYFSLIDDAPLTAQVQFFRARLFFAPAQTHVLAILFLLGAIAMAVFWRLQSTVLQDIHIPSAPGSFASISALTAQSELNYLLDAKDDDKQLKGLLAGKHFRIDQDTGRIRLAHVDEEASTQGGRLSTLVPSLVSSSKKAPTSPFDDVSRDRLSQLPEHLKADSPVDEKAGLESPPLK